MDLAFVAASAMSLKDAKDRALNPAYIISLDAERRYQRRQAVILPPGRDGIDHVTLQGFLSLCALGIDNRGLTGHGDSLLHTADAQLRVHCRDECY